MVYVPGSRLSVMVPVTPENELTVVDPDSTFTTHGDDPPPGEMLMAALRVQLAGVSTTTASVGDGRMVTV